MPKTVAWGVNRRYIICQNVKAHDFVSFEYCHTHKPTAQSWDSDITDCLEDVSRMCLGKIVLNMIYKYSPDIMLFEMRGVPTMIICQVVQTFYAIW